jgi:hypothetical protein
MELLWGLQLEYGGRVFEYEQDEEVFSEKSCIQSNFNLNTKSSKQFHE